MRQHYPANVSMAVMQGSSQTGLVHSRLLQKPRSES